MSNNSAQNETDTCNPREALVTLFESEPENPHEAKSPESPRGKSRVEHRRNLGLGKHKENGPCNIKSPKTFKHGPTSDELLKPATGSIHQSTEETCKPPIRGESGNFHNVIKVLILFVLTHLLFSFHQKMLINF